jgi:hypothetical protein
VARQLAIGHPKLRDDLFQPRGISTMDGFHPWRIALAQFASLQKRLAHANVFGAHGDELVPESVIHNFFDRLPYMQPSGSRFA